MFTHTLELVPLNDFRFNPRNPKHHAHATIGASINRFGMIEPIIVDKRTGYLISGHGRVTTLRQMRDAGEPAPDGIEVTDIDWLAPAITSWASANDQEAEAALVALNRTTEIGGWNTRSLADILETLTAADALAGVGYGQNDLNLLLRTLEAENQFTQDFTDVIDEFIDQTGTGSANFEGRRAFRVLRVVFPHEEGVRQFFDKLGLAYEPTARSIAYPHAPERLAREMFNA